MKLLVRFLTVPVSCSPVRRSRLLSSVAGIAIAALAGCAGANVSNSISLPFIPLPESLSDTGKGAMVFVEEVKDLRASQSLGQGPSGPINPVGSPTAAVRNSLEDLLRKSGFTVTDSAPIVLQVKLNKWTADVRHGYPAGVSSEASVGIEVYDPGNKLAYNGTYKGTSEIEQSGLDDRVVKDALANSMSQALTQFSRDTQVQKLIASF